MKTRWNQYTPLSTSLKRVVRWLKYIHEENKDLSYSQCHACWWPGDIRSQVISRHGIDQIHAKHFVVCAVNITSPIGHQSNPPQVPYSSLHQGTPAAAVVQVSEVHPRACPHLPQYAKTSKIRSRVKKSQGLLLILGSSLSGPWFCIYCTLWHTRNNQASSHNGYHETDDVM